MVTLLGAIAGVPLLGIHAKSLKVDLLRYAVKNFCCRH